MYNYFQDSHVAETFDRYTCYTLGNAPGARLSVHCILQLENAVLQGLLYVEYEVMRYLRGNIQKLGKFLGKEQFRKYRCSCFFPSLGKRQFALRPKIPNFGVRGAQFKKGIRCYNTALTLGIISGIDDVTDLKMSESTSWHNTTLHSK